MEPRPCILLFVKQPVPGTVKTRLGAELGMEAAATAYRRLTECVVGGLPEGVALRVCHAPDGAGPAIAAWLGPQVAAETAYFPQGGGGLGDRMTRAFAEAFAAGFERVVIIGSDCIDLTPALFGQAFQALAEVDLVIGPSTDGGYYLLGLRAPEPRIFSGVAWSTEQVLPQTLERADALGWSHRLLPALTDVDTLAEWREVAGRLRMPR